MNTEIEFNFNSNNISVQDFKDTMHMYNDYQLIDIKKHLLEYCIMTERSVISGWYYVPNKVYKTRAKNSAEIVLMIDKKLQQNESKERKFRNLKTVLPYVNVRKPYKIYVITNKETGESYIGKTGRDVKERINEHLTQPKSKDSRLYKDLQANGLKMFETKLLYGAESNEEASEIERFLIAKYDTYRRGYNNSPGGEGGYDLNN